MNFFHFSLSKNKEEDLINEIKMKLNYFNKDILININWMLIGEIIKSGNAMAKTNIKKYFSQYGKKLQENQINNKIIEEIKNINKKEIFSNNFQKENNHPSISDYIMEINSNSFSSENSSFNSEKYINQKSFKKQFEENNNFFNNKIDFNYKKEFNIFKNDVMTKIEIGKDNNNKEKFINKRGTEKNKDLLLKGNNYDLENKKTNNKISILENFETVNEKQKEGNYEANKIVFSTQKG